ncbi:MAG TPA: carboxylesterase family protein [Steroidobacteraceae bacterium]|nr:carboxylesterase family protein [Steroidobacteraceae bacterium]
MRRFAPLLVTLAVMANAPVTFARDVAVEGGLIADRPAEASGVRVFKGIPYATPPVGERRWREPAPPQPWRGARSADTFGPRCMQQPSLGDIDPLNPRMSEDCLYLNIWTPARRDDAKLPVLVWLHGGGLNLGSGSEPWYNGENLARRGIVVVTINYRLNVFGFLAHPELTAESPHKVSGNYGILDQILALQWIRAHIAAFGGDPAAVTVAGSSSGSRSISVLMSTPLAKGLFQRAIGQSGVAFWGLNPDAENVRPLAEAEQRGQYFASMIDNPSIGALRAKPAQQVLDIATLVSAAFGLTQDGRVMPKNPLEYAAFNDTPLILGWTANEGTRFNLAGHFNLRVGDFAKRVRAAYGDQADALLSLYPHDTLQRERASSDDLNGDERISFPSWKWAQLRQRAGKAPTYLYVFDHRPPAPPLVLLPLTATGAFHTSEIVYMFDNLQTRAWPWSAADRKLAEQMSSYWINFIKTGDPNAPGSPQWQPRGARSGLMRFGEQTGMAPDPHADRYRVLDAVSTARRR